MWRLARRRETQYVSYSLQTFVFRKREPAAKEIKRLHWRLGEIWSGGIWSGEIWSGEIWSGVIWSGVIWSGGIWSGEI